jgi:transposase
VARLTREEVVTIQVLSEKQVSNRQTALTLGVTEGTVRYHRRRMAAGSEDGRARQAQRAAGVAQVIEAWWQPRTGGERPPNARELYEELVAAHGYAGSYKSVVRFVRKRYGRPPIRTWRRVETPPGAQTQTDWGHYRRLVIGGEECDPFAFVMSLSWSRYSAIVWSERKDQVSWLSCHNAAFKRLGGVAAVNRIDNEKTAIAVGAGAWGVVHPTYAAYARTLGFHVDACQPREPQAKGKAEAKVKLSRALGPRRPEYDAIEELQEESDTAMERWARRAINPLTGRSVWETWQEERKLLRPLPEILPEPFDVVVSRPVHRDCRVHFEGRQYPVPFALVGQRVEVRGCARTVQIVQGDRIVREYPRGTAALVLVDATCYEGEATDRVLAPQPLGRMGRKLQEIWDTPVEHRPLDLYAALAEVAR